MIDFKTSSDLPYKIRGGDDIQTATYNRIAAIDRINYIVKQSVESFDLREKSKDYLTALDMELWRKFYSTEAGDKRIDEEFCQRAAKVCLSMENYELKKDEPPVEEIPKKSTWLEKIYESVISIKARR